jgi:hypothetical protein
MGGREVAGLFVLLAFAFVVQLIIWLIPVFIALACIAAVAGVCVGIAKLLEASAKQRRESALNNAASVLTETLSGSVCEYEQKYCLVDKVRIAQGEAGSTVFAIELLCIEEVEKSSSRRTQGLPAAHLKKHKKALDIPIPALMPARDLDALRALLTEHPRLTLVSPLSLEYRATQASFDCHQEAAWAKGSLNKLEKLIQSINEGLARANGNELIQPSVPRMEKALQEIQAEKEKILLYRLDCLQKLEKLHDFLSLPVAVRPLLDGDIDVFSPGLRGVDIKETYNDVLLLAEAYGSISPI